MYWPSPQPANCPLGHMHEHRHKHTYKHMHKHNNDTNGTSQNDYE